MLLQGLREIKLKKKQQTFVIVLTNNFTLNINYLEKKTQIRTNKKKQKFKWKYGKKLFCILNSRPIKKCFKKRSSFHFSGVFYFILFFFAYLPTRDYFSLPTTTLNKMLATKKKRIEEKESFKQSCSNLLYLRTK